MSSGFPPMSLRVVLFLFENFKKRHTTVPQVWIRLMFLCDNVAFIPSKFTWCRFQVQVHSSYRDSETPSRAKGEISSLHWRGRLNVRLSCGSDFVYGRSPVQPPWWGIIRTNRASSHRHPNPPKLRLDLHLPARTYAVTRRNHVFQNREDDPAPAGEVRHVTLSNAIIH